MALFGLTEKQIKAVVEKEVAKAVGPLHLEISNLHAKISELSSTLGRSISINIENNPVITQDEVVEEEKTTEVVKPEDVFPKCNLSHVYGTIDILKRCYSYADTTLRGQTKERALLAGNKYLQGCLARAEVLDKSVIPSVPRIYVKTFSPDFLRGFELALSQVLPNISKKRSSAAVKVHRILKIQAGCIRFECICGLYLQPL